MVILRCKIAQYRANGLAILAARPECRLLTAQPRRVQWGAERHHGIIGEATALLVEQEREPLEQSLPFSGGTAGKWIGLQQQTCSVLDSSGLHELIRDVVQHGSVISPVSELQLGLLLRIIEPLRLQSQREPVPGISRSLLGRDAAQYCARRWRGSRSCDCGRGKLSGAGHSLLPGAG